MARTINSNEDIISAGERLESQSGGAIVEAWEVFKDLGGRGKYERVRDIWDGHVAARSTPQTAKGGDLPADVETALDTALATLGATVRRQFTAHVAGIVAGHVQQMQLAQTQYSSGLAKQSAQTEYWRDIALDRQEQIDRLEVDLEKSLEAKPVRKSATKRKVTTGAVAPLASNTSAGKKTGTKQSPPSQRAIVPPEDENQPSLALE